MGNSWSGAQVINNHLHLPTQQFPYKTAIQTVIGKLIQAKISYKGKDTKKKHRCQTLTDTSQDKEK